MNNVDNLRDLIRNSYLAGREGLAKAESKLLEAIKRIIRKYLVRGVLQSDETDFVLFKEIEGAVMGSIIESGYISTIDDFIPIVDKIEGLAKDIIREANPNFRFRADLLNLNQDKKLAVDSLVGRLTGAQSIRTDISNPIRKIISDSIQFGATLKEAVALLEPLVIGDAKRGGLLSRFYKNIALDSLNTWNGTVNQKIALEYNMIDYSYVGAIKSTSRPQCIRWVTELGGLMTREVIDAEMKLARRTIGRGNASFQGYSVFLTPSLQNFPVIRGGHGCGHQAVPTLLSQEEAAANISKYNSISNSAIKQQFKNLRDSDDEI